MKHRTCCVPNCKSGGVGSQTCFRFPANGDRAKVWVKILGLEEDVLLKNTAGKVCPKHFREDDLFFQQGPKLRRLTLRPGALPKHPLASGVALDHSYSPASLSDVFTSFVPGVSSSRSSGERHRRRLQPRTLSHTERSKLLGPLSSAISQSTRVEAPPTAVTSPSSTPKRGSADEGDDYRKERERKQLVEQLLNNPHPLPPIVKPYTERPSRTPSSKTPATSRLLPGVRQHHKRRSGSCTARVGGNAPDDGGGPPSPSHSNAGDSDNPPGANDDTWSASDADEEDDGSRQPVVTSGTVHDYARKASDSKAATGQLPAQKSARISARHPAPLRPSVKPRFPRLAVRPPKSYTASLLDDNDDQTFLGRAKRLRALKQRLLDLELRYEGEFKKPLSAAGEEEKEGAAQPMVPAAPDDPLLVLRKPGNDHGLVDRLKKHRLPEEVELFQPKNMTEAIGFIHQLRVQNMALKEEMLRWAIKQKKTEAKRVGLTEGEMNRKKIKVIKMARLRELEAIETGVRDIFSEQQVKAIAADYTENSKNKKKVVHWKEEDFRKTVELRMASNEKVVNFVRQQMRIPLPCLNTVQTKLNTYPDLKEMWKTTQEKANKEKLCAMCEGQLDTINAVASGTERRGDAQVGTEKPVKKHRPADPWGPDWPPTQDTQEEKLNEYGAQAWEPQSPRKRKSHSKSHPSSKRVKKKGGLGKVGLGQLPMRSQKKHRRDWDERDLSESEDYYPQGWEYSDYVGHQVHSWESQQARYADPSASSYTGHMRSWGQ